MDRLHQMISQSMTGESMTEYLVYRNLHNGLLSIKDRKTRLVVAHSDQVTLVNATTVVNESGRQRVLTEKKKNVHAYIRGQINSIGSILIPFKGRVLKTTEAPWDSLLNNSTKHDDITYNPYKFSTFVIRGSGESVSGVIYDAITVKSTGELTGTTYNNSSNCRTNHI